MSVACGLSLCAAASAQAIDARVTTGLPQVTRVQSEAVPWRYVSLRASAGAATLEARLPECTEPRPVSLAASVRAGGAAQQAACAGIDGAALAKAIEQEWVARWRLPRLLPGGPLLELSWQRLYTPSSGIGRRGATSEERAQTEFAQALGAWRATAGYIVPLGATRAIDPWATTFAGLRWSSASRLSFALTYDFARELQGRGIDRQVTLRVSKSGAATWRWSAFAQRQIDDTRNRWDAGFGLDWRF
jgi:hypothetical protein